MLNVNGNQQLGTINENSSSLTRQDLTEITESDLMSEISEPQDLNLENFESFVIEKKPVIYQNNLPYEFNELKERSDVFVKNYMMQFGMHRSLKIFEQEFFEKLSKNELDINELPTVPTAYIKSQELQEKIGNIQRDLDDAKIYAEKAKSQMEKLTKAKENQKIRQRRVQQEKLLQIKEINNWKKICEEDEKLYKEEKKRYWNVTKESLVIEQKLKNTKTKHENSKDQLDKVKRQYEDLKKQYDRKFID
jgi:hypothetical protein